MWQKKMGHFSGREVVPPRCHKTHPKLFTSYFNDLVEWIKFTYPLMEWIITPCYMLIVLSMSEEDIK